MHNRLEIQGKMQMPDPTNELQNLSYDPATNILTITDGQSVDLSELDDEVSGGDDQTLQLEGTELTIEDGNSVDLSVLQDGTEDADADVSNEIQTLSYNSVTNTLTLEPLGGIVDLTDLEDEVTGGDDQLLILNGTTLEIENGNAVDLSVIQDGTEDADADPNNELQDLNFNTNSNFLSLSNGQGADLSSLATGGTDDQELTLNGTILQIEDGNNVDLAVIQDGTEDADADPSNEIQTITFDPSTNLLNTSDGQQIDLGTLDDEATGGDDQTLSLNGTVLEIENGNTVDLSVIQDGNQDADADPNNEIQDLTLSGTNLSIENGNSVNLAVIQDGVNDADADPSNELQDLSFNAASNTLNISGGTGVDLSSLAGGGGTDDQTLNLNGTVLEIEDGNSVNLSVIQDGVNDADADPNNELQDLSFNAASNTLNISGGTGVDLSSLAGGGGTDDQTLNLNGTVLEIEDGNSVNLSVIQDGVIDSDADPNNEIQDLTLSGTNLSIENGNTVNLAVLQDGVIDSDADPNNELQDLNFNPSTNQLSITGGAGVDLSALAGGGGTDDQTLTLNGNHIRN